VRPAGRRGGHGVWQTGAEDIQTHYDTTDTQVLARQAPGVISNVLGKDFRPDVSYRGFDATPVTGSAEGIAARE
jgi:predicted S18 family serine protease